MKIILLQDVEKLGKKFDIKEVADGYASNFLFPRDLAKPATRENIEWMEIQKETVENKAEEALKQVGLAAGKLDGFELEIPVKIGDKGQLFEKVGAQKIASALKEAGFDIKKNQVELAEDITESGESEAKIKFEHGLEVQIKIIVVGE